MKKYSKKEKLKRYIAERGFLPGDFGSQQMDVLLWGYSRGLDISKCLSRQLDAEQMIEIVNGLVSRVDVDLYAKSNFDADQMYEIRTGLENGVDASKYADARYSIETMELVREYLEKGIDLSVLATVFDYEQLWRIVDGLEAGVCVTPYAIPDLEPWEMQNKLSLLKSEVAV